MMRVDSHPLVQYVVEGPFGPLPAVGKGLVTCKRLHVNSDLVRRTRLDQQPDSDSSGLTSIHAAL